MICVRYEGPISAETAEFCIVPDLVDPAETRTPVVPTLCKKYEAYIEIKVGIVIPVEFRIPLQLDLVSTDLPTL